MCGARWQSRSPICRKRSFGNTADAVAGNKSSYRDKGQRGAKQERPALNLLLNDLRKRKVDVILVWSLASIGKIVETGAHHFRRVPVIGSGSCVPAAKHRHHAASRPKRQRLEDMLREDRGGPLRCNSRFHAERHRAERIESSHHITFTSREEGRDTYVASIMEPPRLLGE
jgi:Resolvase, N terminal domain